MGLAAHPDAPGPTPPTEAILARLMHLHPKLIDLSLGRLQRLLGKLGNPERHLPPVIHVAGTNGKGSTIAYMRAALEAAGLRVHVMTSPHLVRFNERIRLAGQLITDDNLTAVLNACEQANGDDQITYFEVTTAAAFLAFRDCPADILLLETGLGGRLDASNVIERPLLTAIASVSMDHQNFLGDSLAGITREKAGILKPGVLGVISRQNPIAEQVIALEAAKGGAPLLCQGLDWQVHARLGKLEFQSVEGTLHLPLPNLNGVHQLQNAGLALACLQNMEGFSVPQRALAQGLTEATWPGRLQRLSQGPLHDQLGPRGELWLDGGHNPDAGAALAETLGDWQTTDAEQRPLHLIMGMLANKDAVEFLAPFKPLAAKIHAVPIPYEEAAMAPAQIVEAAAVHSLDGRAVDDVPAALASIIETQADDATPRVLICGSLYLAGSVLATNPQA